MKRSALILAATISLGFAATASAHPRSAGCHVPKLSGVNLKVAHQRLSRAHCSAGVVHRPKVASGVLIVSGQRPKAGAHRRRGAKVALWLKPKTVKLSTTKPTVAAKVTYSTRVDPTFTQDPSNPLHVTYTYDAGATDSNGQDLGQEGLLPAGVLNFYSATSPGGPEQLFCSVNVGGSVESSTCDITYAQTGTYEVTTQYIPNSATAVTETDSETVTPVASTTLLAVAFGDPFSSTGPPPTYLQSTNWFDGVDANYSEGDAGTFSLTLTDETTGVTQVGSAISASSGCAFQFVQLVGSSMITINPGCGLPGISFSDADVVSITATTPTSGGFLGSTSAPTGIWG